MGCTYAKSSVENELDISRHPVGPSDLNHVRENTNTAKLSSGFPFYDLYLCGGVECDNDNEHEHETKHLDNPPPYKFEK